MSYETLKSQRTLLKAKITRICNWFETNVNVLKNPGPFEERYEFLKETFKTYDETQDAIELISDTGDTEVRGHIEARVFDICGRIKDCIAILTNASNVSASSSTQPIIISQEPTPKVEVKLPHINIKCFNGDISEWDSFYQLFDEVVNKNMTISNIQKFVYLKSLLRDEPLKLVENLRVTNENYASAVDILRKRYENRVAVINSHIISIMEISPITKCTATALREFVANFKRSFESLKNLDFTDRQVLEFLLIYSLGRKLDFSTRKAYETNRDLTELPDLAGFITFLENRALVLENIVGNVPQSPKLAPKHKGNLSKPSFFAQCSNSNQDGASCLCCGNRGHNWFGCEKFRSFSPQEKQQLISSKKLCFNCLSSKHAISQCPSSRTCAVCSRRHHTLLHQTTGNRSNDNYPNSSSQQNNSRDFSRRDTSPHNQRNVSYNLPRGNQNSNFENNRNGSNRSRNQGVGRRDILNQPNSLHVQEGPSARSASNGSQNSENSRNPPQESFTVSALSTKNSHVLLATAVVSIYDSNGHRVNAKAILDSGSQNSFITERLVQKLNYTPFYKKTCVSGIALSANVCKKMIDVVIHSNVYKQKKFKIYCAVLPTITCQLPQYVLDNSSWNIPDNISLSDPYFSTPSEIDILIGADVYYDLLSEGKLSLGRNLPTLLNTHLGWIVGGTFSSRSIQDTSISNLNISTPKQNNIVSLLVQTNEQNLPLEQLVSKFWTIEEVPQKPPISLEDETVEENFQKTTKILPNGRFQVDLPFKSSTEYLKLGDSFKIALKRFQNLERKFEKSPDYYKEYKRFIAEYESLGHGKFVPLLLTNELKENKYFLPHHAVIKMDSITTKLRVVFDASCKTTSGVCLNDVTFKGFQVQPDLYDIVCRFRSFKYVLTSDIEKMFRQILINPDQRFLLNILWRDNPGEELKCLELATVTYGTNCAPYLATRVLKELAEKNASKYPLASRTLLNMTYIDDALGGVDDYCELHQLYDQLNSLLNSYGFQLHKWCSNSSKFLSKISEGQSLQQDLNFDDSPNKVLGLQWNPSSDVLCVSIPNNEKKGPLTKRKILSIIAQCYDPLGFLSLVIVTGKLIVQRIWTLKLDWDTPILDETIIRDWNNFFENLPLLKVLKIPRFYFLNKSVDYIELHGFADASMQAYAACVYVRSFYTDGTVYCTLVSSKSRVAPLKTVTLPRMELCAMLLLAQLVTKLMLIFKDRLKFESVFLWTDSQIALCWIQSHASRWSVFVSNRVAQIQDLTSSFYWKHVRSADNPADLPSRGVPIQEIPNLNLWWQGPSFLSNPEFKGSKIPFEDVKSLNELPEERKTTLVTITTADKFQFWTKIFSRISYFSKLQRVLAYIIRFVYNAKNTANKRIGPLSVDELKDSLLLIVKVLQAQNFSKEIQELQATYTVTDKQLRKMNPFLDSHGFLRIGGRLENANISYEQKHPLLLPSHNSVVSLMLFNKHKRLGHAGAQNVLSNFRLRFWPLNGLRETKKVIRNCVTCFRFRAQPAEQIMADLPKDRVQESRCFSRVGVDYGGPFFLKSSNLRKSPVIKCYVAIFICMATKAIHLELVSSLSTESFLMTLKRFISRRGNPNIIHSDNATNFVGSRNQLRELYDFFKERSVSESIHNFLAQNEIKFQFIPPRSPHWGGIWEAAVKSMKYHFYRLVGETRLTFEEFYTVLNQIEAILNSRPICPTSNDPNDLQVLTPGHFLIGTNMTAYPDKDLTNISENRLSRWQRVVHIQQLFWKRWKIDYLNRLQNRPKWFQTFQNLKENDLVLLKEDDTPPLRWPLARVLEVIPGADGKVRVVKLKTQDGVFTRSIAKVCPLPQTDIPESQIVKDSVGYT